MKKSLRLTSFFSLVSIPVMILAIVVLVFIYRLVVLEGLQRQVEQNNTIVAKSLSNVIWDQVKVLEGMPDTNQTWTLNDIYIDIISKDIYQYLHDTPVLKIKVYNSDGKTVYSTDKKQVGEVREKDYPGNVAIDTGTPLSELSYRKDFLSIEGPRSNIEVLATYIPVYKKDTDKIDGVFEIYTDVTEALKNINDNLFNFTVALIFVFAVVYAALFFMVSHADKIILKNKEDLKKKIEEVEDMNIVLENNTKELAVARDLADHANVAKSQFLANMSHELRTPLNAILGYTELIIESAEQYGDEEINSDLGKVHQSGTHLLELIGSILDLSKIEAGRMEVQQEDFDIKLLLHEITDTVEPIVKRNHNEIKLEADFENIEMLGDMLKIRQILFNLISNSAKFTKNGVITLKSRLLTINGDEKILFEVLDTGIGISAKNLGKLFAPFEQVDSSVTREYGGTGLGLTITKRFCTMMGGEIEVDSEEGKGTKFTVFLPFVAAPVLAKEAMS